MKGELEKKEAFTELEMQLWEWVRWMPGGVGNT